MHIQGMTKGLFLCSSYHAAALMPADHRLNARRVRFIHVPPDSFS